MATYVDRNIAPVLDAARQWAQQCLVDDGSVLGGVTVWTAQNLALLERYFIQQPDAGSGDFYTKLDGQMAGAPPGAPQLMAELLWVLLLFPSNTGARAKREGIERVWNLSGVKLGLQQPMLGDDVLIGIGSAGTAFNTLRWMELNFAIDLFANIKQMPRQERVLLVTDYERLSAWLQSVSRTGERQFRHMLRYLLCPGQVERMSSNSDRRRVLTGFGVATLRDMKLWSDREFDDALLALRSRLVAEYGTNELDFYRAPLVGRWQTQEPSTSERAASTTFDLGYAELRERFLRQFPRFKSFATEPDYLKEERHYKDELIALFHQSVMPALASTDWLAAGAAAIELLTRALSKNANQPQNIVGWRYVDLLRTLAPAQRATFGQALQDLLDEEQPLEARVDAFVEDLHKLVSLGRRVLPAAQRSITGFYLALADSKQHLFLKTQEMQRALRTLEPNFRWASGRLSGSEVSHIESLAVRLFERLENEGWAPKDLIDVQGFLWVATAYGNGVAEVDPEDDVDEAPAARMPVILRNGPLNQILYGPPGTGKTFQLQRLLGDTYTEAAATIGPAAWRAEQIASRLATLTWWEVLGAALYEMDSPATVPQLAKHSYVVAMASSKGRSKGINQTIWGTLQHHALTDSATVNIALKLAPFVFDKSEDSKWRLAGPWKEHLAEVVDIVEAIKQGPKPAGEPVRRYAFVTFHQSFSYEEFMEGLTPVADEETGSIRYEVKKGVFLRLCDRARADTTHPYAMVIDEINRGNVSKVFGELITLIETDKRAGCENPVSVTLPYSGESFSVPANVHLIGTMNTADRSLAGLDIALRRRFEFVEMPARPELLAGVNVDGIDIAEMLSVMNRRIEVLLDRDHHLGHAYFMPLQKDPSLIRLAGIFGSQILPLLQEYFFEDWQRIAWVLNDQNKGEGCRFVVSPKYDMAALFGGGADVPAETRLWELDRGALHRRESYLGIVRV